MMTIPESAVKPPAPLPERVRAVLYDMDGVLVDSSPAWFRVLNRAAARFGAGPVDHATFEATFGQGIEADRRHFFPERTADEIVAFYDRTFPDELAHVVVAPGAPALLERLRDRGLQQAVVTNAPRGTAARILEETGIAGALDVMVASGDAPEKPAPDLVHLALRRLGVPAGEAVYVGDTATDRQAAEAAGVFFVGLRIPGAATLSTIGELEALLAIP